jgi:hypothetical protein
VGQADDDDLRDVVISCIDSLSTSIEATFSPSVLMTSLRRSVNQRMPSASKCPTSPEWNQPCSNAASAASGCPGIRSGRAGPVNDLSGLAGCQQGAMLVHDRDLNVDHGVPTAPAWESWCSGRNSVAVGLISVCPKRR